MCVCIHMHASFRIVDVNVGGQILPGYLCITLLAILLLTFMSKNASLTFLLLHRLPEDYNILNVITS